VFAGAKSEIDRLAQNNQSMADSLTHALLPKEAMKADFKQQIADIYSTFADPGTRAKYLQAAAQQYADHWRSMTDSVQTANDQMSQFAKQAANNMQDAFAQFLFDPFKDGLDGLIENFTKTLQRMVAQAAASRIFQAIGDWGKSASGGGGFWGAVGSFVSSFGGGKASGGAVSAGRFYEVNERRTELLSVGGKDFLMMGGKNGRVNPNPSFAAAAVGGGVRQVQINVTNKGQPVKPSHASAKQDGKRLIVDIAIDAVSKDITSGGRTAKAIQQHLAVSRSGVPMGA